MKKITIFATLNLTTIIPNTNFMKKNLLSIALIGTIGFSTFNSDAINFSDMSQRYVGIDSPIKALTHQLGENGISLKSVPQRVVSSEDPTATVNNSMTWGFLKGPDGSDWFYSQTFTFDGWYYASTEITVYDSDYSEVGKLSIQSPEGLSVNQMEPFGAVTTNFFERNNSTYEIAIFNHAVTEDYMGKFWVDVYTLTTGEKATSYECEAAMFFDASTDFKQNPQLITCRPDNEGNIKIDIYNRGGWDTTEPVIAHTFTIEAKLINYMDAAYINAYNLDGKIYYVLSHYEKEYMIPTDDFMIEPEPTPDNTFVLEVFDNDFQPVTTLNIPLEGGEDAFYTFAAFGIFSTCDLSIGKYSGDDQLNFIISRYDYLLESDGYVYHFDVFDQNGDKIANIGNRIAGWIHMSTLKGYEDQVGLIKTDVGEGMIEMVDLPSCNLAVTLPGIIDNRLISTNIDRCINEGDYKYVISVSQGDIDKNGNVISSIGWYDSNGQIDHYVDFTLDANVEYFSAYINGEILNPYLVDSDAEYEYVFLTKTRNTDTNTLNNNLYIAKEDGSIIRHFSDNEEKGLYYNGGFIATDPSDASLFIAYCDADTDIYTIDFYQLPLEKFEAGGDGSAENPYIITSAGDLEQIANEPEAHYILGCDIDLADYSGTWRPIPTFAGSLDGQNHAIKNLYINSTADYCGLFGYLDAESKVRNIVFIEPTIEMTKQNYYTGIVAGMTMKTTIDNIHIFNPLIIGNNNTNTIGGMIGEACYYTSISRCSVNDIIIDAADATYIGGIAGDTRTATTIMGCYVGDTHKNISQIVGLSDIGGVVGMTGSDCEVKNCNVSVNIIGQYNIGGIVGNSSSRGLIQNNIVRGMLTSNAKNGVANIGGICGYLEGDWTGNSTTKVIYNNIAAQQSINASSEAKSVGRIVGWTIDLTEFEEGEKILSEIGIAANHADKNMLLKGNIITSDNLSSIHGCDLDLTVTDKAFYETYGFLYGKNMSKPWKEDATTPVLYFQNIAKYLSIDKNLIESIEGEDTLLTVNIYGNTLDNITISSSNENVATINELTSSTSDKDENSKTFAVIILSSGSAVITVECDGLKATCDVIGISSIEEISNNSDNTMLFDGKTLFAEGSDLIEIFATNGIKVAHTNAESIEVSNLSDGLYIAVATKGNTRLIHKFIIK